MNVFVTGATGFVGEEIVAQLLKTGHSVRILARNRNSKRVEGAIWGAQVEVHPGDILEPRSLEGALKGIDAVIHLIGIISEIGASTFENVHTQGTKDMVTAALQAGVNRFIQMSALGTRHNAVSRYHQSKWAAEQFVRESGLQFTIFRPSLIYGPRDQFVNLFAKIIRYSPILPVIGGGRSKFQPISVEVVGKAFVGCLTEPKSFSQTYDLCGPETFTLPAILDEILAVMRRKRWKLRLPLGISRAQAAFLEFVFPRLLRSPPPLNRDQLIMLQEDNVGDGSPANELFDLQPMPFREGIGYLTRPRSR